MSAEEFFATPENVPAYLVRRGLLAPGEPISVAELGGGVSNIVLRIESGDRRWVLKQSLAKLRVKDDWQSDRARIFREAEAIEALRPVLGSTNLPHVVHVDREDFLFIMTAAPLGSYACTSWPRAISSLSTPRKKCALPWFQHERSECVK